jgi:putative ATP-binding cassette transporter
VAAAYGQAFYFIIIGAVLFLAPRLGVTDVAVLTGFALTILYMNSPISSIVGLLPSFSRAAVSLDKLEQLGLSLAERQEVGANVPAKAVLPAFRDIEIRGMTYTYWRTGEDRPFTLGPLDLALRKGELVFVTGGNGSGKSSFARLATGLYVPDQGNVHYNGVLITDVLREAYRQKFSAVFSDFFLFDMLFGMVTPELHGRVQELLELFLLRDKVAVVDGRFSTTSLSQGQRKRLALLTAFIEDRELYLFDEWAADQDPEFKQVFYMKILPDLKARGKTAIVISHDDHYYHVADRVLKFEDGALVDEKPGRAQRSSELLVTA